MSGNKSTRAERRQRNRKSVLKQSRIFYYHNDKTQALSAKQLGRMVKHKALNCGQARCVMCGNPRTIWGLVTLAERRSMDDYMQ
jgi:hypothetical protein